MSYEFATKLDAAELGIDARGGMATGEMPQGDTDGTKTVLAMQLSGPHTITSIPSAGLSR